MVKLRLEWTDTARVDAIRSGAERLLGKMTSPPGEAVVWCLREVIWPGLARETVTAEWIDTVELALVPLARIGQMAGNSGSLVLIGRLWAASQSRPSNALVVKTRKKGGANVLREEWVGARAAKPHTYDRKDSFAIPVHFDDADEHYDMLWSLYLPSVRESEADTPDYGSIPDVGDLRTLLGAAPRQSQTETPETHARAKKVVQRTFRLLRNLHRSAAAGGATPLPCEERVVGEEYGWYLRSYGTEPDSLWGPEWKAVWGPPTDRGNADRINPLWVVEKLKPLRVSMQLGLVHGDLHPGNIIVRDEDAPALIDFGWSVARAHVAKDFALMECNLRFLTLRASVADADLEAFSRTVAWEAALEGIRDEYLTRRWDLIQLLRQTATGLFAANTNWDREYLVPVFLVGFGLLRFAPQLGNQRAAIRFIEQLARHLDGALALGAER